MFFAYCIKSVLILILKRWYPLFGFATTKDKNELYKKLGSLQSGLQELCQHKRCFKRYTDTYECFTCHKLFDDLPDKSKLFKEGWYEIKEEQTKKGKYR